MLVQLSSQMGTADDSALGETGETAATAGVPSSVFILSGLFACVNLANSITLYSLETRRANEKAKLE